MNKVLFFVVLMLFPQAFCKPENALNEVQAVFKKYRDADSVFMKVEKKSIMGLLNKTSVNEGRLLYSKGLLRLDFVSPEASSIIFNKDKIIVIKPIKEGLKEKTLVTYINRNVAERQHALMGLLFGDEKVWTKLKFVTESKNKEFITLDFLPIKTEDLPGVIKVSIVYDQSTKEIARVKQLDDSENEVQFNFSNLLFDLPVSKKLFEYTPKKTDQVTNL